MTNPIILATANARYGHTAIGLRWLHANLGRLRDSAAVLEFTIRDTPQIMAEALLEKKPRLLGLGVYIWNVRLITETVRLIKTRRPQTVVVIGGPEVSHEYENTPLFDMADYLVRGEGELAFADLASSLMAGDTPARKVLHNPPADLDLLQTPYDSYTAEDIERRTIYVESSRGCPFRCSFCLSSLDNGVREFPVGPFLDDLSRLMARGARRFKFVDRTFNLRQPRVVSILNFFLQRPADGLRLHFEVVPDKLTPETLELFARFAPGALHLEAGVQSFHAETLEAISRRQDMQKTVDTIRFLRHHTGALIHADLVAGMPGETWQSFARGFDELIALRPHALQVGILKRLKGAPLARYDGPHKMTFRPEPPYDVIETDTLDAAALERVKRFARYFDIYYNSGNFPVSCPKIWENAASPFEAFMSFSDFLWQETQKTHGFPLIESARLLCRFLIARCNVAKQDAATAVETDFRRVPGRKERLRLN